MDDDTRRELVKAVIGLLGTAATLGLIVLGAKAERSASSPDWHPLRDIRRWLTAPDRAIAPAPEREPSDAQYAEVHEDARRITRGCCE